MPGLKSFFYSLLKKYSLIVIFLISLLSLNYGIQNRWKDDNWKLIIKSDGYGYYSYLPCIFIYHKFDYQRTVREASKFRADAYNANAIVFQNKEVDKCFPGVALLLTPFFLLAYLLSYLLGYGTGGYEFPFQASVSIGALFYLTVGLIFLRKLLKEFNISEFVISLTLLMLVFGTNLLYYATLEPCMSHVYSFGLMAVFLFFTKRSIDDSRFKNLVLMTIAACILVMIRPTNMLSFALILFIAGSFKSFFAFIVTFFKSRKVVILFLIAAGIFSIQSFLWYLQTDHFFVWSYPNEGFNFKKSHFWDIMFSFRKGWFIYTPLMLIAILGGLAALLKQNLFRFFVALFFSLFVIYVFSSWSSWTFEGDYGLRAFVDFYSFFAILLSLALNTFASLWVRMSVIFLCVLSTGLNLFQMYQVTHWILPNIGMDEDKYWKIFLKSDKSYSGSLDRPDTIAYNPLNNCHYFNDFEHNAWGSDVNITGAYAHSGDYSAYVNDRHQHFPLFSIKASMLPKIPNLFVYVKLWVYMPDMDNDAALIVYIKSQKGDVYLWRPINLQGFVFKQGVWTQAYTVVQLPDFKDPTDELSILVNNHKSIVYVDDIDVTFETPKL
ncbi:MAG: hypothetical protein ACLQQ4_12785 [Bacteroidia bacterium]